jgi:hypothetical protein
MLVTDDKFDIDIEIDKNQVCHYTGYDADYKLSARISSLIDDYSEHAHHLINPAYTYIIRDVEWARGSISFVEDSIIIKSKVITQLMEHCSKIAIFLVTIGEYLEETAHRLAKDGCMLQATVLDAVGSDAVEKLAEFIQDRIREGANTEGLVTSQRVSPGYCDWNIGQQRMLFRALKGNTLGVHLTGECLMLPQKTISGIIGIGPSSDGVENYNPCRVCDKQDCSGRRLVLKI